MLESSVPHHAPASTSNQVKPKKHKKVVKGLLALLLLAAITTAGVMSYLYYTTNQKLAKLSTPAGQQEVAQQEIKVVVDKLGKLTLLPDENPVVATIIDPQLLATQSAFYAQTQKGDKLVVYPKAQKAYIYSPERNVIVNSGPLILDNPSGSPSASGSPTPAAKVEPLTVEVRNGSTVAGSANRVKSAIESDELSVATVADAARKDYQTTQVIGLKSGVASQQLTALAQQLKGTVASTIPTGEVSSDADILIIVGEEQ